MYSPFTLPLSLLITTTTALHIPSPQLLNDPIPASAFSLLASENATFPSKNTTTDLSATHEILTACDANIYGIPDTTSCLDVYRQLSDDSKIFEFGDRTKGTFQYPLPYRFSSEDGTCVIDIENLPFGRFSDRARLVSIRAAALTLMSKCVFEQRAGGVTTGLGKSGNLVLAIRTYDTSNITCQRTMSRSVVPGDCKALLEAMPTSTDEQVFGPTRTRNTGEREDEVELPYDLVAPGKQCGFFFNHHGGLQKRRWYDLWQAATAINAICGRRFEVGSAVVGSKELGIDIAMHKPREYSTENGNVDGARAQE